MHYGALAEEEEEEGEVCFSTLTPAAGGDIRLRVLQRTSQFGDVSEGEVGQGIVIDRDNHGGEFAVAGDQRVAYFLNIS